MLLDHFLQNHALACIFQDFFIISPRLFKNTVGKTLEAENINIQDSLSRVHLHQCFLGLHGELLRDNNIVISLWMFHRLPDHSLICKIRFSGTGTADNKL